MIERPFSEQLEARVYVAGHTGLVGRAVVRKLEQLGFRNIITRSSAQLDLRNQQAVNAFFDEAKPAYVVLAAARVGGIVANATYPGQFIYDNLMIATNVIEASRHTGVTKLLNLGSSCIYPRLAPQPLREEYLLQGPLEETNRAYAVAKIAAIELCDHYRTQYDCDFISAMPTNLYGPHDNFDLSKSHVIPGMIHKLCAARDAGEPSVMLWGTGTPRREFLFVSDLAEACVFLMDQFSGSGPINVGTGVDVTIKHLAEMIQQLVGFSGALLWDTTRPDGTPRKLLDVSRLAALGYQATTSLSDGLATTVRWFEENHATARGAES